MEGSRNQSPVPTGSPCTVLPISLVRSRFTHLVHTCWAFFSLVWFADIMHSPKGPSVIFRMFSVNNERGGKYNSIHSRASASASSVDVKSRFLYVPAPLSHCLPWNIFSVHMFRRLCYEIALGMEKYVCVTFYLLQLAVLYFLSKSSPSQSFKNLLMST